MNIIAEYIWIDGQQPTAKLRSKTKVVIPNKQAVWPYGLEVFPEWSFDGSSTYQAEGHSSDLLLKPVRFIKDPVRQPSPQAACMLVLCEVLLPDGTPHKSNARHALVETYERFKDQDPLFGIEQEYTLYDGKGGRPYGWPPQMTAFPAPQGQYYCGVGSDEVYGRKLIEAHLNACLTAEIAITGINPEVMPAQWEFQVGTLDPVAVADQLWLARWILYRLGEDMGISVKLDPKPLAGDWNGAGAHTNFSTAAMRADGGLAEIIRACDLLGQRHAAHIKVYGAENHLRLTGKHETCDIDTFRYGVGDRGASVRIPAPVAKAGCGYLEDRRPAANMDPYQVCRIILETVCGG